uniref:Uncharacterized protein n=1 Tax=Timema monikensis TaxID=170555 RepID=A0A7R9ELJ8_9NEOP|nr:unnamed protein product [Timema monikensis]
MLFGLRALQSTGVNTTYDQRLAAVFSLARPHQGYERLSLSVLLTTLLTPGVTPQSHDMDDNTRAHALNVTAPDVLLVDYVVSAVDADLRDRVSAALLAETAATNDNKWLSELNPGPCPSGPPSCPPSKYRASEGVCNNVRHPQWGSRGSPFLRLLPPNYQDGKYRDPC